MRRVSTQAGKPGDLIAELARFLKHTREEAGATDPGQLESDGAPTLETLSDEVVNRLPKLAQELQAHQETWERLQDVVIIDDIEVFAIGMQKLGQEYGYSPLADWGERLEQQAQMFDMDAITATHRALQGIIDNIQKLSKIPV